MLFAKYLPQKHNFVNPNHISVVTLLHPKYPLFVVFVGVKRVAWPPPQDYSEHSNGTQHDETHAFIATETPEHHKQHNQHLDELRQEHQLQQHQQSQLHQQQVSVRLLRNPRIFWVLQRYCCEQVRHYCGAFVLFIAKFDVFQPQ